MHGFRRLARLFLLAAATVSAAALTPMAAAAADDQSAIAMAAPAPFSCAEQSGGTLLAVPSPAISARAHSNRHYDRFVIALRAPLQQFDVKPQATTTFVLEPSGTPVTLLGKAGLLVTLTGAQANAFTGSADLTPKFPVLKEARQISNVQGVVTWGLGLSKAACFRAVAMPRDLIVDVQH